MGVATDTALLPVPLKVLIVNGKVVVDGGIEFADAAKHTATNALVGQVAQEARKTQDPRPRFLHSKSGTQDYANPRPARINPTSQPKEAETRRPSRTLVTWTKIEDRQDLRWLPVPEVHPRFN